MIQLNSNLHIADNSGAKIVKCIKVFNTSKAAKIGDKIVVAVQKASPNKKIKSGEVGYSLIIRCKKETKRKDGVTVKFSDNSAIMLTKKETPIASRIFGPVPQELRSKKNMKIMSIAQGVI